MLAELAAFRPFPFRITLDDGEVREIEATLVAVGNGFVRGRDEICAGADLTDGLFDVTVLQPQVAAPRSTRGHISATPRSRCIELCRRDHRIRRRGAARAADRGMRTRRGAGRGALSSGERSS
jgi:hypothetical protein